MHVVIRAGEKETGISAVGIEMTRRKGFLSIEYAFLIAILIAALIGMSVYIKRSLQSKWRDAGDSFGYGRQYNPK